jgi:DNA-binding CsgD family transcriptional regulator
MSFTFRPTRVSDLAACMDINFGRYAYAGAYEKAAQTYWAHLIATRSARSRVVEDPAAASPARILAFGLSIFVGDDFMVEVMHTLPPHVGLQTLRRWLAGKPVFLDRKEIARQNAGEGLNLLVVGYGVAPNLPAQVELQARATMIKAFADAHGGYRLKQIARENLGTEFKDGFLSNGWRILRHHPVESPILPSARDGPPTHILGVLRDGRLEVDGNFWLLLHPEAPRLGLTAVEKDTLEAALENSTDEEISDRLGVSIWTIKKRWQSIYAKAEQFVPGVFPDADLASDIAHAASTERRRHLLGYIRQHPEEIRPRSPE